MSSPVTTHGQTAIAQVAEHEDFLEGFISEKAYAARRGVSLRTCQRDRQLRQSPPFVLLGRQVYYRVDAVRDWLIAREQSSNRKPSAPRVGKTALYVLQSRENSVCASLGTSNISAAPKPETVIIATELRRP